MLHRLVPLLALLVLTAACGTDATDPEDPAAAQGGADGTGAGLTVVTTTFPLASMAGDIAPGADVRLLTSSGQDPHDLELSPTDRALIETADVVLYLGDIDFQPQVETAVADASGQVVAVAEVVGPSGLRTLDDHAHDDDTDHHEDEAAEDHGDEEGAAVDPHVWFDAGAMAEVAEAIGEALAAADEAGAATHRAAGEALHDALLALDDDLDSLLSGCARDTAIVSHEAYAYLLEPRDLEQEGISGAGGHGDASPQRLAELTDRIRAEGIPAVLAEPVEGRADAESLAAEAGVALLEIDPLEIGTDDLLAVGYPEALRAQAATFAEALGCG